MPLSGVESPGIGDIGELYRRQSGQLKRIVRSGVHAPDAVIEDACQFAWGRLVRHRDRIQRDKVLSWLVATAVHEAFKLLERAGRDLSLDAEIEQGAQIMSLHPGDPPQDLAEARERLASLAALPQRQQVALWLYGLGLSYAEIAQCQGSTARAVERQLHRARKALRAREGGLGSARFAGAASRRAAAPTSRGAAASR